MYYRGMQEVQERSGSSTNVLHSRYGPLGKQLWRLSRQEIAQVLKTGSEVVLCLWQSLLLPKRGKQSRCSASAPAPSPSSRGCALQGGGGETQPQLWP